MNPRTWVPKASTLPLDHRSHISSISRTLLSNGAKQRQKSVSVSTLHSQLLLRVLVQQFLTYALNPLNTQLNPICHLLALLGAHPIRHVSRIRVNYLLIIWFLVFTTHPTFRHFTAHLDNKLFRKQPSNCVTGQSDDDTNGATCQESGRSLSYKFCLLAERSQNFSLT